MLVSFGPRADQYRAYLEDERKKLLPGTTGDVTDVQTFYNQTRDQYFPAAFSLVSLLAPLAAFVLAVWLFDWFLSLGSGDLLAAATPVTPSQSNPPIPLAEFCLADERHDPLTNGVFAATFHFAVAHVTLFVICALALVAAAASLRNVLETHGFLRHGGGMQVLNWCLAFAVPIGAGYLGFHLASVAVGNRIQGLFERLFPIPASDALKTCELKNLLPLKDQLFGQMGWGALGVSIGVASLILAVAMLTWRFETHDINGAWSDSYVLRHKLNSLLTLFFIGSILLVVTNIALASAMDWTSGVLDVVNSATATAATSANGVGPPAPPGGSDAKAGAPAQPDPGAVRGDRPAKPDPIAAEFASLKTLKTAILGFAGALGSLILILIFVPALYGVTSEIEIAGKTHASHDMAPPGSASRAQEALTESALVLTNEILAEIGVERAQPKPNPETGSKFPEAKIPDVAGWKIVQEWKEKHGLKLSFTDLTSSFVAALAPLLSGSVIDLTKMTMGAMG